MELHLASKKVIVLASSKGLGRASAKALAEEGATVVISSRSEDNLATTQRELAQSDRISEDQIIPMVCDLSESNAVRDTIEEAIDELGGLDILVTNRGGPPEERFDDVALEDFDEIYESVLRSSIAAIKASLPHLQERGGAITNIIATSVQEPTAHHVLANTIRPGIYGLSKSLANEYGDDGIRVNCVTPRGIWTDRAKRRAERFGTPDEVSTAEAEAEGIDRLMVNTADHSLGRFADPDEFGRVVAFVSSDAAGYVTGEVVNVDGGWSRHLL